MKKKIFEFYASKRFELTKLYRAKPQGLSNAQVQAAAQELYKQIQRGLEIKNINIARRIFELAKTVEYKEFVKDQEIIETYKPVIRTLKRERIFLWVAIGVLAVSWVLLLRDYLGGF